MSTAGTVWPLSMTWSANSARLACSWWRRSTTTWCWRSSGSTCSGCRGRTDASLGARPSRPLRARVRAGSPRSQGGSMNLWVGAVALGLAFAASSLGVFLTFRVLAFPDLTIDGSFPLGAAVSAILLTRGWDPWLTLLVAALAGALAGSATALLNSRLKINGLLAGILVSIGLWTVNLRVMQEKANVPLLTVDTVLTPIRMQLAEGSLGTLLQPVRANLSDNNLGGV